MKQLFFTNLLSTLFSIALAAFFCVGGIMGILISWSPKIRGDIIQMVMEDSIAISLLGFGFFIIGITLIVNLILSAKKRYYHLRSGTQLVAIDESLIQEYLEGYWKKLFPNCHVSHRLELKKERIYITADLPHIPQSQQKLLLERVRSDLNDLFGRIVGYRGEFFLSTRFSPQVDKQVSN